MLGARLELAETGPGQLVALTGRTLRPFRGGAKITLSEALRMKLSRCTMMVVLASLLAGSLAAQQARPKRLLFIGESMGFQHDSISYAAGTLWKLGHDNQLWETYIRTDTQLITKKKLTGNAKNLDYFDAVAFYTTGELDLDDSQKADLMSFIKEDGKGFIAIHSGTDTFYNWHEYGEMVGGYFDDHPWNTFNAPLVVEDPAFPGMKHLAKSFTMKDEIYQTKTFSRDRVRVLLRLDDSKLDLASKRVHRTDKDFAVMWARDYGKGRVLYNGLGHVEAVWDRPDIQKMWIDQVKWAMGLLPGDATPRPRP
jgi:type 1 glutamine amidotransferase